jgi:aminopyrrolnitrin oxygenase
MTVIDSPRIVPMEQPESSELWSLRAFPQSWYMICQSSQVLPGQTYSADLLGHPIVLFRTADRALHALSAHCSHMGTHLGGGTVVGDCLRCPLHQWQYDGSGVCRKGSPAATQRAWPVAERLGAIFIFNGSEPLFPLPTFQSASLDELTSGAGKPVAINCPWIAIPANAYDMQHLHAVHERALRQPPEVDLLDRYRLRLCYVSRVTGKSFGDRAIKLLSNDHVQVSITCWGGTLFTVESQLGRRTSMLLLGMTPTANGVLITPVVAMRRIGFGPLDRFRVGMAQWLFTRFLRRDITSLQGMRFKRPTLAITPDDPLQKFFDYLDDLPVSRSQFKSAGLTVSAEDKSCASR